MSEPRLNDIERRIERLEGTSLALTSDLRMQRERLERDEEATRSLQVQQQYHSRVLFGDPGTATESLPVQLRKMRDEMEIMADAVRAIRERPSSALTPRQFAVGVALIIAILLVMAWGGGL